MVSLVNSARVAAGKGGLGWLNPSLYKYSSRFANDIRKGNNRYTYYNPQEMKCSSGFEATEGWDPASGWGSLNFTKFKNLFLSFGNELNIPTAAPTATARPTNRPTKAAVWLYRNTYSEPSCFPRVSFFYNDGCSFTNGNFNQTISYESGCSREADTEYYYEESVMYSSSWQCSSAPNYQSLVLRQGTCVDLTDALNGGMAGGKSYNISLPFISIFEAPKWNVTVVNGIYEMYGYVRRELGALASLERVPLSRPYSLTDEQAVCPFSFSFIIPSDSSSFLTPSFHGQTIRPTIRTSLAKNNQ
eukprot:gene25167-27210_t